MPTRERKKPRFRLLTVVVSSVLTYLVLELVFFPVFLPHMPLRVHAYLHEAIRVLAQSSKSGTFPRDYVALVGDSYAQGNGDWLYRVDHAANPPFHSAHGIAQRTGRDVVTYGDGGAGSVRGIALEPVASRALSAATWLFDYEPPTDVLVYFYEGNDLNDNLRALRWHFAGKGYDASRLGDPSYMQAWLEDRLAEYPAYRESLSFSGTDNLLVQHFILFSLANGVSPLQSLFARSKRTDGDAESAARPACKEDPLGAVNAAVVGGKTVALPDELNSPALELTDDERDAALIVFEQSVRFLAGRMPDARIGVVYIPSPLSTYELASPTVSITRYDPESPPTYPSETVWPRSDAIERRVAEIAAANGWGYADARPAVREAARSAPIHGPCDFNHFNKRGYEALAGVAASLLSGMDR